MSRRLTIEVPDEVFEPLAEAAKQAGQSPEQWATAQLRSCVRSSPKHDADIAQLLIHAGAVNLGRPTGADNESIDLELAREYASAHEREE